MARIEQGILGGLSGKIGSVIGSSWKGIDVLRSKPLSVANPRTVGQVNQRNKLRYMVALSQAWLGVIIKPLWDRYAQKQSGYNAFVSANIGNVENDGEEFTDYSSVIISKGKLGVTVPNIGSIISPATTVTVTWSTATTGQQQGTDVAYIGLIVENTTGDVAVAYSGALRSAGTATVSLPEYDAGVNVHCYLAFRSADGKNMSNTGYDFVVTSS